jgi:hypothetical protein
MWPLGAAGRRGLPNSGDHRRRGRSGRVGEGSMGRYGSVWALGLWGDVAGGRRTGSQGVPAAAAGQAGEGDLGRWLKLAGELLGS